MRVTLRNWLLSALAIMAACAATPEMVPALTK
jgi:hypothetical protein